MKKIICLATLICGSVFTQLNATTIYTTTCGKQFIGPDESYFETWGDYWGYRNDVNIALCGVEIKELIEDGDPIPAI